MMMNAGSIDKCDPVDCSTCGAACGSQINLDDRVIELTTDEGDKYKALVVLRYKMENKAYIAVMPLLNNPEADIYLYKVVRDGKDLDNIEDEDEYAKAAEAFGIAMEKAQAEKNNE